jgi:DNA modification methylase
VAKAKSRPEALNIAKKKLLAEFTAKLAEQYIENKGGECPHTLFMDSCLTILPNLDPGIFDVIITDPPYGIDAHKMSPLSGSMAGTQHEYTDDYEYAFGIWECIFKEGVRISKENCAIYMFCDFQHYHEIALLAASYGWKVWDRPIIWHKPGGGMLGDIQHGPRRSYETILFAYRGDKRTMGAFNDVVILNGGDSILHAAAKPPALYAELLRRSSVPGMIILDPCAGSGPVFVAANMLNLTATGIEVSRQHAATALSRINNKE